MSTQSDFHDSLVRIPVDGSITEVYRWLNKASEAERREFGRQCLEVLHIVDVPAFGGASVPLEISEPSVEQPAAKISTLDS